MAFINQFRLLTLAGFFLSFLLFDISAASVSRKLVGGFSPVDPKDPEVVEIGKFAVEEHNKEAKTGLMFEKVVKGESQVVAGTNYKLTIAGKDGDKLNNYEAMVWVNLENVKKLTSFTGPL